MTAPFGRRRAVVASERRVGAYHLLELAEPRPARPEGVEVPDPLPGQFYMLAAGRGWGAGDDERPYLPRAFSAMGGTGGRLWFMLEGVGPGTRRLAALHKGEAVWVTGPLGHGFRIPEPSGGDAASRRPLLVGGGIGLPPLVLLSQELLHRQVAYELLLGFRDGPHAQVAKTFARAQVATDDGSVGHHGRVTELLAAELDRDPSAEVFACGPPAMLEAIRVLCVEREVPAQLALESGMACGYGACYGCVVPLTRGGYTRVCVDGPVYAATEIAAVHP